MSDQYMDMKEEIYSQQKLLDVVSNSKLRRTLCPPAIQQLVLNEDEVSTMHLERNSGVSQERQRVMEADEEDSGGSDSDMQSEPDVDQNTVKDKYSAKEQKDRGHRCSKFSKIHKEKSNLDAHMGKHTGGCFGCPFCGRVFKKRQALMCHLKSHATKRSYSCTGKQFIQNASLKCHMKTPSRDKLFCCTTCKITFRSSKQVKIHKCTGESSDLHNYEPEMVLCGPKTGEMFSSRYSQQIHKKTCLGKDAFTCTECGMHFQFISQLKSHRIKHTRERQFSCSVCKRTFRWLSQVKFHQCDSKAPQRGSYKPVKAHSCPRCGEMFSTKVLLKVHKKTHLEIFSCAECGMQFQYRSQLRIHMRKHTGEKPYGCPICGKKFSQIGITKQHMLVHSKEKPFSCNDCGKKFSWQFQVKRHACSPEYMDQIKSRQSEPVRKHSLDGDLTTLVHNRSKVSIESEDNDKDFWKETRQHQSVITYQRNKRNSFSKKEHTTTTKKPLDSSDDTMCDPTSTNSVKIEFNKQTKSLQLDLNVQITGEAAISDAGGHPDEKHKPSDNSIGSEGSHTLHIHLRHRIGDKPFGCEVCGKRFVTGGHLSRHTSVHTGEKLLSCVVCKRAFSLESDLMSHECDHDPLRCYQSQTEEQVTANKLLSCSHCDEAFVLKRQLQMHMKRHTVKKNFRCSVCNESFARQDDLTCHVRSHIRCTVCNAVFSDRDSLVLHMRSHTLQTQFHCSVCNQEFAWRRHLIKHMEVHINEKPSNPCEQDDMDVPQCSGLNHSEGNSFRCPVCHVCFSDKESFDQHSVMHSRATQLCDSFCYNDFTEKQHLMKQIPVWENENIYGVCSVCNKEFSCQNELTHHHCVTRSSNSDADSDPDTDDSDFWKETKTHQLGSKSGKSKIFECGLGCKCDKCPEYLKPQNDDSVDSDSWKGTKKIQSHLTSDKDNEVSDSDSKMDVQQFLYKEDLTLHKTSHAEVKKEDAKPPQIKEEKEDTAITNGTFSLVPVKTEEDEEKPQCAQHHHSKSVVSGDSLRGPEVAKNSELTFGAASVKSDESVDSDFWKETKESHSGLHSESDDCKIGFSGSDDKASESLQPESDHSVDSDFWKESSKLQAVFDSKDNEHPNREVSNEIKCRPYSCNECGKKCLYLSHYERHMKRHTEKREFLCSFCGNEFPYKSHLKIHMRTHTGEKPFSCPVCDKKYAQKASMQAHMVIHTVENQYSCDVCDKSFAWYTELKYHQCVGESSHEQL